MKIEETARRVSIGGATAAELRARLAAAGVALNAAGEALLAHPAYPTSITARSVETVELSVAGLGCPAGATIDELCMAAAARGLVPGPLELAPHLRLQWLDQPEGAIGRAPTRHRAPPGSVTVASTPLAPDDHDVPKGFYLRRIDGVSWLRGYVADGRHVWSPDDRFVFCRAAPPND
jgi:hypothetical protein